MYEEFSDIPLDISAALRAAQPNKHVKTLDASSDVRAVVVDKDNCLAQPHALDVWPAYQARWDKLKQQFPGSRVLIVSNSAGSSDDTDYAQADLLSQNLKTDVLRHKHKKPACSAEIMQALKSASIDVEHPSQVIVIGDRLFTDVLLANLMGSHSIWLRRGTLANHSVFSRIERAIYNILQ